MSNQYAAAMAAALLLDAVLGDPPWMPHPVVGFGRLIRMLEKTLRQPNERPLQQFLKGLLLLILLLAAALLPSGLLLALVSGPLRFIFQVILFWLALAQKSMRLEAEAVERALTKGSLGQARLQVARIVGRDTDSLSRQEVARACIESVAESTSDGIIAPMFFGLVLGPAGAMAFKAVSTLDSMVGYNDSRYRYFGKASARADDLLNLLPARITGILAALLAPSAGGRAGRALSVYCKDRANHASPNSGHPEAAFAGALDRRLGGPSSYGGQIEQKPYFNPGAPEPEAADIRRSVRLMQWVSASFLVLYGAIAIMTGGR